MPRIAFAAAVVLLVTGVPVGLLAVADFVGAGRQHGEGLARVGWTLRRGDHLHYAVHLMAGRVLELCPCTHAAASSQYERARYHALTRLQRTVVAPKQPEPGSLEYWVAYATGPMAVAQAWLADGVAWLRRLYVA